MEEELENFCEIGFEQFIKKNQNEKSEEMKTENDRNLEIAVFTCLANEAMHELGFVKRINREDK